jgi:hypothetical protein
MIAGLIECTMLILSVINDMYKQQKITFDEFLSYTNLKIPFLSENIECISSEEDRIKANLILSECTSIIFDYIQSNMKTDTAYSN